MFSILSVQNDIKLSLISVDIAPSTTILLSFVLATYFYAIHVRANPKPPAQIAHPQYRHQGLYDCQLQDDDDRPEPRDVRRRSSIFRRFAAGLRGPKRERVRRPAQPLPQPSRNAQFPAAIQANAGWWKPLSEQPLGISFRSLGFGLRGGREAGEQRRILPAGVPPHQRRRKEHRLLEPTR